MLTNGKRKEQMWERLRAGKERSGEGKGWNEVCPFRGSIYLFGLAVSGKFGITFWKNRSTNKKINIAATKNHSLAVRLLVIKTEMECHYWAKLLCVMLFSQTCVFTSLALQQVETSGCTPPWPGRTLERRIKQSCKCINYLTWFLNPSETQLYVTEPPFRDSSFPQNFPAYNLHCLQFLLTLV